MTTIVFVLFWVLLAIGLVIAGLSGGGRGAIGRLQSQSRGSRRFAIIVFFLALLLLGVGVPYAAVKAVSDRNDIPAANVSNLTPAEEHGRQLFAARCGQCHTLAAAKTVAQVGPNLDQLRPPKVLVLDAIKNGRARGNGQMAAGLFEGKDADDVASFVAKAVGQTGQAAASK